MVDSDAYSRTRGRHVVVVVAAGVAACGADENSSATRAMDNQTMMSDNDVRLPKGTWAQQARYMHAGKEEAPEEIDAETLAHTSPLNSLHAEHTRRTNTLD
jgi:hypothetical protein